MATTRRIFVTRILAGTAAAALPTGHVAHALTATAEPEPIPISPGVDVIEGWNAVTDDDYADELERLMRIGPDVHHLPQSVIERKGNYLKAEANGVSFHGYVNGHESTLVIQCRGPLDHGWITAIMCGAFGSIARAGAVA